MSSSWESGFEPVLALIPALVSKCTPKEQRLACVFHLLEELTALKGKFNRCTEGQKLLAVEC